MRVLVSSIPKALSDFFGTVAQVSELPPEDGAQKQGKPKEDQQKMFHNITSFYIFPLKETDAAKGKQRCH